MAQTNPNRCLNVYKFDGHDGEFVRREDYDKLDACVDTAKAYIEALEEPNSMALRVAMLEAVVAQTITAYDATRLRDLFDADTAALVAEVLGRSER